jgi:hypothetical protein
MNNRLCAEVLALGSAELEPSIAKHCSHIYKTLSFYSKVLRHFPVKLDKNFPSMQAFCLRSEVWK